MLPEEEFIEIYEYIQGSLISNPGYSLLKKRDNAKKVKSFLDKHTDLTLPMYNFITFIFVLRTSKYNRYKIIPFNQFTSENAYKAYKERDSQQIYFTSKFQMDHNLSNPIKQSCVLSEVYLDEQRQKYFGTPRGYIICSSFNGILYNRGKCMRCKFNYICSNNSNL